MTTQDSRKEALQQIVVIMNKIDQLYLQAKMIADKAGVAFSANGPAYGMGGYYIPQTTDDAADYVGWVSSFHDC